MKRVLGKMYESLQLAWSVSPSPKEAAYRAAGLVKTQGSIFLIPPDENVLIEAFEALPRPQSRMSSGAKALCKHFERGGASSEHGKAHPYWPLPVGSNENKSRLAAETLQKMLKNIAWKNMLMLHPNVAVYEIRNNRGFGMRWSLDLEAESPISHEDDEKATQRGNGVPSPTPVAERDFRIKNITFRGFLEPIIGLDQQLPQA